MATWIPRTPDLYNKQMEDLLQRTIRRLGREHNSESWNELDPGFTAYTVTPYSPFTLTYTPYT